MAGSRSKGVVSSERSTPLSESGTGLCRDERNGMIEDVNKALIRRIAEAIAEGDLVATHSRLDRTDLGPFVGIPRKGRRLHIQNVSLDRVVDGVVVEHHGETGWFGALFELGVLPVTADS